ncbi:transposase [Martelella mediterranea]|uniref:transposase n=1 Tax=Martelella mediterranea TaxID=293089 RepID=UPI001E2C5B73|nr:transposase [Martelella mediterranea]MCD1635388.1 transposase [Martelella mediterranea]
MASVDIWGFKVGLSTDGRKIWPKSLKREAVRRVRDEGCPVKLIADELGTRDFLVRKWVKLAEARATDVEREGLHPFAEVKLDNEPPRLADPSRESGSSGRLLVGGVCLEFPLSIADAELAKLIRVAGQFS